jgi:hypothetical protein
MRVLAAHVLTLVTAACAAAGNCDACMETAMCVRHGKEEQEALKIWKRDKGKKDPMVRKAALDKLGKANDSHLNCRHPEVAEEIAGALADDDSGMREAAVTYLSTNQHRATALKELISMMEKILAKVGKPKPGNKNPEGAAEWDLQLAYLKRLTEGLASFQDPEVFEVFAKGVKSPVHITASTVAKALGTIRSRSIVEALIDKLSLLAEKKDPDAKGAFAEMAPVFNSITGHPTAPADDAAEWLKSAKAHWRTAKATFVETPDPNPPPTDDPK